MLMPNFMVMQALLPRSSNDMSQLQPLLQLFVDTRQAALCNMEGQPACGRSKALRARSSCSQQKADLR
jgi:hypothetical protein